MNLEYLKDLNDNQEEAILYLDGPLLIVAGAGSGKTRVLTARIGANAVVTKDVPENAVMVGIPAKNVGTASEEFKPYGVAPGGDTKLDV